MAPAFQKAIPVLFIAALPFFVWGGNILQGQMNGFVFLSLFAAGLLMPSLWLKIIGLVATAWLGLAYAAAFVGTFPVVPFIDASLILFFGLTFFLFVFHMDISFDTYAGIICASVLIQASLGICQWLWFDPVSTLIAYVVKVGGETGFRTPVGTLGNPNFLGAYLAISLPFFFRSKWKWCLPVIILGLCAANSSTAVIAAIFGTAYFLGGWMGFYIGVIPAVVYLMGFSGKAVLGNERIPFWMDAVQKVCHSPASFLFGFGQGTTWQIGNQLHSQYAATLFSFGFVGLSCMIAYIVTVSRKNKTLFTAFIILCINMIANHPLHVVTTAILAITIMALCERDRKAGRTPSQVEPVPTAARLNTRTEK